MLVYSTILVNFQMKELHDWFALFYPNESSVKMNQPSRKYGTSNEYSKSVYKHEQTDRPFVQDKLVQQISRLDG